MSVNTIFEQIASTASRNEKASILKQNASNHTLKRVCKLTLDPFTQFFIKKIPQYTQNTTEPNSLEWALDQLNQLIDRTVTGNLAIDHLRSILSSVSSSDALVVERIISKDLKCGIATNTVNSVWPKLIPETPYMRCSLPKGTDISQWDWASGIYSQLKADGSFANVHISSAGISIYTRSGNIYPLEQFASLVEELSTFPQDVVLNGELLIYSGDTPLPRKTSNGKLNSIAKGGENVLANDESIRLLAWDIIPYEYFVQEKYPMPYATRYADLVACTSDLQLVEVIETRVVHSLQEAMEHYSEILSRKLEGTILKTREGIWAFHTSRDQVKLKIECSVEVEMLALNPGNGKNAKTFGSVECASACRNFIVNVSGFTDNDRVEIAANWGENQNKIITIMINDVIQSKGTTVYSAFLPRFVEHRPDKSVADSLPQIIEQFESIVHSKGK